MRFSGERLAKFRTDRKMGQHELAEAARKHGSGVNQASVSKHENGMEPSARNAMAYARALGVSVTDLYELDDDEEEAASMPSTRDSDVIQALAPLARLIVNALDEVRVIDGEADPRRV